MQTFTDARIFHPASVFTSLRIQLSRILLSKYQKYFRAVARFPSLSDLQVCVHVVDKSGIIIDGERMRAKLLAACKKATFVPENISLPHFPHDCIVARSPGKLRDRIITPCKPYSLPKKFTRKFTHRDFPAYALAKARKFLDWFPILLSRLLPSERRGFMREARRNGRA